MISGARLLRRVAFGAAAFLLTDLVTALTIFSAATLSILWFFSFSWIQLVDAYAATGAAFGTVDQLHAATAVLFVAPALGAVVLYLGAQAYRLPRALWRVGASASQSHPASRLRIMQALAAYGLKNPKPSGARSAKASGR